MKKEDERELLAKFHHLIWRCDQMQDMIVKLAMALGQEEMAMQMVDFYNNAVMEKTEELFEKAVIYDEGK